MTESEPQLVSDFNAPLKGGRKTKKHGNASLRAWVTFVKKVAKEEKIPYKQAMTRASERKDKGEKWMKGGNLNENEPEVIRAPGSAGIVAPPVVDNNPQNTDAPSPMENTGAMYESEGEGEEKEEGFSGGRKRRHGKKSHKKRHPKKHATKKRRGSRKR